MTDEVLNATDLLSNILENAYDVFCADEHGDGNPQAKSDLEKGKLSLLQHIAKLQFERDMFRRQVEALTKMRAKLQRGSK